MDSPNIHRDLVVLRAPQADLDLLLADKTLGSFVVARLASDAVAFRHSSLEKLTLRLEKLGRPVRRTLA